MKDFWVNLKDVVATPLGVIALLGIVVAWVYVTIQRNRLSKIRLLPSKERTEILKREYSTFPRYGISSEEWIKSRLHLFIFLGFIITLVLTAIIVIYALSRASDNQEKFPAPQPGPILTPTPIPKESAASPTPSASATPTAIPQTSPIPPAPTPNTSPVGHNSPSPVIPDATQLKAELNSLLSKLEEQVGRGNALAASEMSNLHDARENIQIWKETNSALAGRIDRLMKTLYGVDTKYSYEVQGTTASSYFWGEKDDQEHRRLKNGINEQLKGLKSIQDKVRRDLIRYGGSTQDR